MNTIGRSYYMGREASALLFWGVLFITLFAIVTGRLQVFS